MKKINMIVLCILVLSSVKAFGQKSYAIDKGSLIMAGAAGFTSRGGDQYGNDRAINFSISPSIEYFVIPRLACGGNFSYGYHTQPGYSYNLWSLGPKFSYYFGDSNSKFYPFISGQSNFFNWLDNYSITSITFTVGIATMISRNVAITGSTYFMMEELKYKDSDLSMRSNTLGVRVGLTIFLF